MSLWLDFAPSNADITRIEQSMIYVKKRWFSCVDGTTKCVGWLVQSPQFHEGEAMKTWFIISDSKPYVIFRLSIWPGRVTPRILWRIIDDEFISAFLFNLFPNAKQICYVIFHET